MRRWEYMAEVLKERAPRLGAELGTKEGKFAEHLLQAFPELRMIVVDLWSVRDAPPEPRQGFETYVGWNFDAIRGEYEQRVRPFANRVTTLAMDTREAARQVEDGSLDFIFIDAEHTYEGVAGDIAAWHGKVKPGGLIAGHDYNYEWAGVMRAVAEAFDLAQVALGEDSVWLVRK